MALSIQQRVLFLALLPPLLIAIMLTLYNYVQSKHSGAQTVESFATQMENDRKAEVSNYQKIAMSSIAHLIAQDDGSNTEQLQNQAKSILRNLRFDDAGDTGYVFVYDVKGANIAHGVNASLEGKNLYDFKDPNGVYLIRELIDAAKKGGGYVQYSWKNTNGSVNPKLGYAALLPKWNWVLGTGFWISGLEQQVAVTEQRVNEGIDNAFINTIIASVFAVAITAAIAVVVSRSITSPLHTTVLAMNDISQGDGDLTQRLMVKRDDELGKLGSSFNRFADDVGKMVIDIRQSSQSMNQASHKLNELLANMHAGINRQHEESEPGRTKPIYKTMYESIN